MGRKTNTSIPLNAAEAMKSFAFGTFKIDLTVGEEVYMARLEAYIKDIQAMHAAGLPAPTKITLSYDYYVDTEAS